ncbi:MAG: YIP1 family protein [Candidatus Bathyarchaeia archaeon]
MLFIGAILILINGLWIASTGEPIVLSSYPVSSIEELTAQTAGFWGRIVFGIRGCIEGPLIIIWMIFAVSNLASVVLLHLKQEKKAIYAFSTLACSLLSIPIGGGFIIGSVLGIIIGLAGVEFPKPFQETFVGKMFRAIKLDLEFYRKIGKDPETLKTVILTLFLVNFLAGFGNGLYIYNINSIRNPSSPDIPFKILLLGQIYWSPSVISTSIFLGSLSVIKWFIFSAIIYLFAKFLGKSCELDSVARVVAYCYVPICLQIFMPLIFLREPLLYFEWPFTFFLITNAWVFIALVTAVRAILDIPFSKALGITIISGIIYWMINNMFLIPTLNVPGIYLVIQPVEVWWTLIATSVIISMILGTFTKK